MGRLVYSAITSLDGYIEDGDGGFEWCAPDAEVHQFINVQERAFGTHLYGRKIYEVMTYWETADTGDDAHAVAADYARIWRGADKIVYSTTLAEPSSARTRIEREFDPEAVRALKAQSAQDLAVGGSTLAGAAIRAGLVDELRLYVSPVSVGGGKPALPKDLMWRLNLVESRAFASGFIYSCYRPASSLTP